MLCLIVALDKNRCIVKNGKLPWNDTEDLAHFKKVTMGHTVIMGRKTYDSIGKPLSGRRNIVISSDKTLKIKGCTVINSFQQANTIINESGKTFIIGGSSLYEYFIGKCEILYLTHMHNEVEGGDVYFPPYTNYSWIIIEFVILKKCTIYKLERATII